MESVQEHLPPPQAQAHTVQVRVSFEVLAYIVLLVVALGLRLAELDTVPLSDREAPQAVAAWHVVYPNAPGSPVVAHSPITFWLQVITFSLLPATEFSARLPGILGGMLLILMPLLFRQRLGRETAFLWSLILATSSIVLAATRFADPAIWSGVFALALLWAIWQYYDYRQQRDSLLAAALAAALIFLAAPSAVLLAFVLVAAAAVAVWWTVWREPEELALETPEQNILRQTRSWLATIPIIHCVLVAISVVLLVGTGFMVYPAGLSTVGEVVAGFLRGFGQPATPTAPPFFALLSLVFYELLLIIFAIIGFMLWQPNTFGFIRRFLAAWCLVGMGILLVYRGSAPGDALWLVIPLSGLATYAIRELFVNRAVIFFWLDGSFVEESQQTSSRFAFVKWFLGIMTLALLLILSVHLQEIARSLLTLPIESSIGDTVTILMGNQYAQFRYSGIWFLMTLLLFVVGFFLAASIWGNDNTLQGIGLGLFFLMLLSGMGGGWNAAVTHADDASEFWHTAAISPDVLLLRTTLAELAQRNTMGFPELAITVLVDAPMGITADGILAWSLRDYPNARFVTTFAAVQQQPIVLLSMSNPTPDLGNAYVGQRFLIRTHWSLNDLPAIDFLAWFLQRDTRAQALPTERLIVWLREDVFNSTTPLVR